MLCIEGDINMSYDDSEGNPFVQDFIRQNLILQLEEIEEERWIDTANWIAWVRGNVSIDIKSGEPPWW
jgi:hypothetical protein